MILQKVVLVQSISDKLFFTKIVRSWYQQILQAWSIIECPLGNHFVRERLGNFIRGLSDTYFAWIFPLQTGTVHLCFDFPLKMHWCIHHIVSESNKEPE